RRALSDRGTARDHCCMRQFGDFAELFQRATGFGPYEFQRALADAGHLPDVLKVPTGSGKTQAIIGSWMYQRAQGRAPRRRVSALPTRPLVEQPRDVPSGRPPRLGLTDDQLPIHVLMGGAVRDQDDWRLRPEDEQIVVGTIDMLLSRALNRGYAE